jgi:hypothetical protein
MPTTLSVVAPSTNERRPEACVQTSGCSFGGRRRHTLDLLKQRQFQIDFFRRRLDDELRIGERLVQAGGCGQAAQHRLSIGRDHLPQLDAFLENVVDRQAPFRDRGVADVIHPRRVTTGDRRMRDPVPHRPGAQHCDCLHRSVPSA